MCVCVCIESAKARTKRAKARTKRERDMDTKIISESSSSLSDLPQEILWLIDQRLYLRLYLRDRVRFRSVCNNWRLPPLFDKLPWLFNRTICSLSNDPLPQTILSHTKIKKIITHTSWKRSVPCYSLCFKVWLDTFPRQDHTSND